MSEQNTEREDIVNKPIVEVPDIESNKHKPKTRVDTSESERFLKQLDFVDMLKESTTVGLNNAERKERELRYNQASLDLNKTNQFKKLIAKSVIEKKKKPAMISSIFYDNKIYTPNQGFTLTEMAFAWLQYFQWQDRVTLEKMKTRIKSWINAANKTHDARIYGTPIDGKITRYHIAKRLRDLNSQINVLDEFKGNIELAEDNRKSLAEVVKKEQEQKPEIVIDTEGNPVPEETNTTEDGGETE